MQQDENKDMAKPEPIVIRKLDRIEATRKTHAPGA
jgi:hypothetical protein